jgi:glycosyltransferase involved in cell wall biosynthesis
VPGDVVYVSHNGLTEPLGRRQVLPYIEGLSALGWRMTVVSFEKPSCASPEARAMVDDIARRAGIRWIPLRYHNRPPVMATAYDAVLGYRNVRGNSRKAVLIHARSTVPALVAGLVSSRLGTPWVFDLRGLLAEEYVDARHWPRGGVRYRTTAAVESKLLRSAHGLVTLTHRIRDQLTEQGILDATRPTTVIPCSVDLGAFHPSDDWRHAVRRELGWGEEPVLIYSGSLGSWYRLEEMLDFFEQARAQIAGTRFLLLTSQVDLVERHVHARGLTRAVVARSVAPDDVPRHLAAGDVGLCFLGRHASKVASSPTKYGEYLAAGLPVVTNPWIGDAGTLASEPAWVLADDFNATTYRAVASRLAVLLSRQAETRLAARNLARREFSLEAAVARYHDLYINILER